MGLSLKDIGRLIATRGASQECKQVRDFLQKKVEELDERIQSMQQFRDAIRSRLGSCESQLATVGEKADCPILLKK